MEKKDLQGVSLILEQVVKEAQQRCLVAPSFVPSVAGKLVSPIPLTHFPSVRSFYPRPLIRIMTPLWRAGITPRRVPDKDSAMPSKGPSDASPFIYTPISGGRRKNQQQRKEVLWVEKDPAEIAISIFNPLPFELRVENMVCCLSLLCM